MILGCYEMLCYANSLCQGTREREAKTSTKFLPDISTAVFAVAWHRRSPACYLRLSSSVARFAPSRVGFTTLLRVKSAFNEDLEGWDVGFFPRIYVLLLNTHSLNIIPLLIYDERRVIWLPTHLLSYSRLSIVNPARLPTN